MNELVRTSFLPKVLAAACATLIAPIAAHAGWFPIATAFTKPILETIIEPCAFGLTCVWFDGTRVDLDPVATKGDGYAVLGSRADDRQTWFLIETTLGPQPILVLAVRDDATRTVKILGFERQIPGMRAAPTAAQAIAVGAQVAHDAHRAFLTATDPSTLARAARAIVDGRDDLLGFAIARDIERLSKAGAYAGAVAAREARLGAAMDGAERIECSRRPRWTSVLGRSPSCARLDDTYDYAGLSRLQTELTRALSKYATPESRGTITACAPDFTCVLINGVKFTLIRDRAGKTSTNAYRVIGRTADVDGELVVIKAIIGGRERLAAYRVGSAEGSVAKLIAYDSTPLEPGLDATDRAAVLDLTADDPDLRRYLLEDGEGSALRTAERVFRAAYTRRSFGAARALSALAPRLRVSAGLRGKVRELQYYYDACRANVPARPRRARSHFNPFVAVKIDCGPRALEWTARRLDVIGIQLAHSI